MSGRFPIALMIAALLAGCSNRGVITTMSSDYNKAMADVRNQQLLLNIMRSSAREPLQFSAMGEIAATVHRSIGVDTVLNNLIVGTAAAAINHSVTLEARNEPVIRIAPLSDKEFTSGILRPTNPEIVKQFIDLGWDAEFMLPLIVAGYRCPGGAYQANTGKAGSGDDVRRALAEAAGTMQFVELKTPGEPVKLVVSDDKALEMMRSGVAGGYKVKSVLPAEPGHTSQVLLTGPAKSKLLVMLKLCKGASGATASGELQSSPMQFSDPAPDDEDDTDDAAGPVESSATNASASASGAPAPGFIKLRSIEGIIYFLGESYRDCFLDVRAGGDCALSYQKDGAQRYLFRVQKGGAQAGTAAIETEFYGTHYWVSRLDPGDVDRTVKTFSFLDQLFALQVVPGAISTTPTVLTIGSN